MINLFISGAKLLVIDIKYNIYWIVTFGSSEKVNYTSGYGKTFSLHFSSC